MNPLEIILSIIVALAAIAGLYLLYQAHQNHVSVQQQLKTDVSQVKQDVAVGQADAQARLNALESQLAAKIAPPAPATAAPSVTPPPAQQS